MDYKEQADAKRETWQELYDRIENDCSLINLETFTLKDVNGKTIPNATSITLNDIAVYVDKVESTLGSADEQITVESEDKGVDTDYIEDLLENTFDYNDDLLSLRGELTLNPYIDQMNCRKGRSAVRVILQWDEKRGLVVPELLPLDVSYHVYGMDKEGLAWHDYKVERDKDPILAEYPDVSLPNDKKLFEVEDIWTRDKNEVWIAEQMVLDQKHNWGSVPVCVQVVPKGSIGDIKYSGESLLYLIRDLVPALNELASEIRTLNSRAVDWALQQKVPKELFPMDNTPDHDKITKPGAVTQVPSDGGFELMPLGELRQQAWLLHQMISERILRGSWTDTSFLTQPRTATEILQIGENSNNTLLSRLATRGLLKRQISKQIINRTIQIANELGKSSIKVGEYDYDVSKLKGKFIVDFTYFSKNPVVDVARYEVANSVGSLVSDYTKRREIIHLQDPDGEERLIRTQQAELLSPNILKYRTVKALLEEAEKGDDDAQLEAEILAKELGLSLEQVMSGNLEPMPPVGLPNATSGVPGKKSLVDLMGTGVSNNPLGEGKANA